MTTGGGRVLFARRLAVHAHPKTTRMRLRAFVDSYPAPLYTIAAFVILAAVLRVPQLAMLTLFPAVRLAWAMHRQNAVNRRLGVSAMDLDLARIPPIALVEADDAVYAMTHLWWHGDRTPQEDPLGWDQAQIDRHRERVLGAADIVIPGHGEPFRVRG